MRHLGHGVYTQQTTSGEIPSVLLDFVSRFPSLQITAMLFVPVAYPLEERETSAVEGNLTCVCALLNPLLDFPN